ncbi:MAG: hypothetical protein JWM05_1640 [Acidimicrobiales bacterium]|nr:hypothetical protein [Acidimicrobiales bacterium]
MRKGWRFMGAAGALLAIASFSAIGPVPSGATPPAPVEAVPPLVDAPPGDPFGIASPPPPVVLPPLTPAAIVPVPPPSDPANPGTPAPVAPPPEPFSVTLTTPSPIHLGDSVVVTGKGCMDPATSSSTGLNAIISMSNTKTQIAINPVQPDGTFTVNGPAVQPIKTAHADLVVECTNAQHAFDTSPGITRFGIETVPVDFVSPKIASFQEGPAVHLGDTLHFPAPCSTSKDPATGKPSGIVVYFVEVATHKIAGIVGAYADLNLITENEIIGARLAATQADAKPGHLYIPPGAYVTTMVCLRSGTLEAYAFADGPQIAVAPAIPVVTTTIPTTAAPTTSHPPVTLRRRIVLKPRAFRIPALGARPVLGTPRFAG